jgi:multiple sugar transport system substrate-binding protein
MSHRSDPRRLSRRSLLTLATGAAGLVGVGVLAACGGAAPASTTAGSATLAVSTAATTAATTASVAAATTTASAVTTTASAATTTSAVATGASAAATTSTTTAVASTASPVAASTASAVAAAKTAIDVWNADWGDIFNKDMQRIGDSYTQAHPEVTINWKWMTKAQDQLTAAIAGGSPPDANYTNYVFLPEMAFQGAQIPLDSYIQQAGMKPADFIPATWQAVQYQGHTYALPGGSDWIVLFWNKETFLSAGLDPETPPKTLQELEDFSNKLYKTDAAGNYTMMGIPPTVFGLQQNAFLMGGGFYDEGTGKLTANDPNNIKALEWEVSLAKRWDQTKISAFTKNMPSYSKAGSGFGTNKQAFLNNGFWAYDPLDKFSPDLKYGIAYDPTPGGTAAERSRYLIQGWDYGIPTGAKHPAESWAFIKYAFYDQAALMGSETLNGPCVLKVFPDFVAQVTKNIGASNRMAPYLKIFTDVASAGSKFWPVLPMSSQYSTAITQAESDAIAGKGAPRDLLDGVQTAMTALLQQRLKK